MSDADPRAGSAKLGMVLAMWAERQPDLVAIRSESGNRSFRELNENTNRLARGLRRRGAGAGTSVALLCANRPEFVESFAATQRTGMRVTPIDWHLAAGEAAYIVEDCEASVLIADARFAATASQIAEQVPGLEVHVAIDGAIEGFEPYSELLAEASGSDLDEPVLGNQMMYTSGTTGRPKGVLRDSSAPQSATVVQLVPTAAYRPGEDLHLCTGPLYHAAPLNFSITAPLSAGVGVELMARWDAERALDLIDTAGVTHTHMVPTMFQRLLALPAEQRSARDVGSLRFVIHGAAPCPIAVKRAMIDWWGPVIHEYYAATEGVASIVDSADWLEHPGTVGRPRSPDHVRVLDEAGRDVPPGEVGALYIKAPASGRFRFHNAPDKTASTYLDDWYSLGDVGYLDGDGWLYLTDRTTDLIISGGVNVYPAEVEAALLLHPEVADVAVIGVPSRSDMGEDVLALVEPTPSADDGGLVARLLDHCREHLAGYKCPRRIEIVDDLPRRDNGKLAKGPLRSAWRAQTT